MSEMSASVSITAYSCFLGFQPTVDSPCSSCAPSPLVDSRSRPVPGHTLWSVAIGSYLRSANTQDVGAAKDWAQKRQQAVANRPTDKRATGEQATEALTGVVCPGPAALAETVRRTPYG